MTEVAIMRGSMYFAFGEKRREGVVQDTTFEAVEAGVRTSTTRFLAWPEFHAWGRVKMGDRIKFYSGQNLTGRSLDVIATADAASINLEFASDEALEEWSRLEGWSPEYGRWLGCRYGTGYQIRFRVADLDDLRLRKLI